RNHARRNVLGSPKGLRDACRAQQPSRGPLGLPSQPAMLSVPRRGLRESVADAYLRDDAEMIAEAIDAAAETLGVHLGPAAAIDRERLAAHCAADVADRGGETRERRG